MRILIITQYFWPENFPINDLALGLREKGHRISILTGMPNYPEGRLFPGYKTFPVRQEMYNGIRVVVTYHPAALLRNPNFKRTVWEDMKMLRGLYDELIDEASGGK